MIKIVIELSGVLLAEEGGMGLGLMTRLMVEKSY